VQPDPLTTRRIASGSAIQIQCKLEYREGHGYTFNMSTLNTAQHHASTTGQEHLVRGQEPVHSVACGATQECQWDSAVKCHRVPCKCMRYSDYLKMLEPRADGQVAPLLAATESDGLFDSGEVRNITCPEGYQMTTPAEGSIATGVINWSSVHDGSRRYTWEVCPQELPSTTNATAYVPSSLWA